MALYTHINITLPVSNMHGKTNPFAPTATPHFTDILPLLLPSAAGFSISISIKHLLLSELLKNPYVTQLFQNYQTVAAKLAQLNQIQQNISGKKEALVNDICNLVKGQEACIQEKVKLLLDKQAIVFENKKLVEYVSIAPSNSVSHILANRTPMVVFVQYKKSFNYSFNVEYIGKQEHDSPI
ncbi:hypothetical protein SERLADRAFT_404730 [Serpula lacrymans var. lacrymans S7.9]|uniref:Uncharacterized protein n=1 Tax=Serpula lacrymans var. lacrymans (strain S7.9) TaxID=578457 RepID=F8NEM0_SERL9|nr:uncharacterized protein SERLADRAFT_404730 [Serpula lacrymans var. lacrymans S7.9]EGO30654.1 hypothetical protein SERLADRAFT_404730 [Serpula lacrymans var. lacrymans S7.9]